MMKILLMIAHGMKKVLIWILILPILFYQKCITPYTPPSCRFTRLRFTARLKYRFDTLIRT